MPDELRRDLRAISRHLWFIVLAFIVAIAAAAASFFLVTENPEAAFRTNIVLRRLPPPPGHPELVPSVDDFARLATSPDVLQKTSDTLAAQDIALSPDALASIVAAQPRPKQDTIDFIVEAADSDLSLTIARAWSDAFASLAPQAAPQLVRQASVQYQEQLQLAGEELARRRQTVADLGGSPLAGAGEVNALVTDYQTKLAAISAREVERTTIQQTLDTLRTAGPLSTGQLRLILGSLLPLDSPIDLNVDQAAGALDLRLRATDGVLATLRQETQALQTTLQERLPALQVANREMTAAEDNYYMAASLVQSYETIAQNITVGLPVLRPPSVDNTGTLDWLGRLSAAAAFALVVGVIGALVLDRLWSGSGKSKRARVERLRPESVAAQSRQTLTMLTRTPPKPRRGGFILNRRARKWKAPAEAALTGVAVVVLAGLLGTRARRQRTRHNKM